MQSSTVAAKTKLQEALDIYAGVRLVAEWNYNRYAEIEKVENTGTALENEYDNDVFPIASIAEGERPTRGIVKGWSSTAASVAANGAQGYTNDGYEDTVNGARYGTASEDAKYKYWTSPNVSASGSPFTITGVTPTVIYKNPVWVNKIQVTFENSYAAPTAYTISVTIDGTTWIVVGTDVPIAADGTVALYRHTNPTPVWNTTTTLTDSTPLQIRGVRVNVTRMNKGSVRLNLIELGARLESDLTEFVEDYSVDNSMSEVSFASPLGVASSNTATVNLSNTDGRFTTDNPTVPLVGGGTTPNLYYGLLEKNVEFRLDFGINLGTPAAPNFEWFRQFTMRTDAWNGQDREGTQVELKDASDYLQSVNPNPFLYQDMTVGETIWRILDSVGFSKWNYTAAADDSSTLLPYFWDNGERSVWEVISELAEATQTAIYFDEFGVLQIKTKASAYNIAASPAWQLNAVSVGNVKPDIEKLEKTYDFEANVVNVKYKPTSISKENPGGIPVMEVVWEPESTTVLRSSQLVSSITSGAATLKITQSEASTWPYSGIIQLEGEFIRYEGKSYTYRTGAGAWVTAKIKSADEKVALDKLNPNLAYQNYFNGTLWFKERGIFNSVAKAHYVDIAGWTFNRYRVGSGAVKAWNGGLVHNTQQGHLTMRTNSTFTPNSWYVATRGSSVDQAPNYYGTRLRFPTTGYTYGAAGIVVNAGTNDNGYYAEIIRTRAIDATARAKWNHELNFYVRYSDGTIKRIGPDYGKGVPLQITEGIWYDLDVSWTTSGSNLVFSIAVNGINRMTATVTPALGTGESMGGRSGMFTRGFTFADFEYYNTSTLAGYEGADQEGWWDRLRGGYVSGQWEREWVYGWRTQTKFIRGKRFSATAKYNSMLMDEFGPVVHEVREFDVDFSKTPVLHSQLYLSNESQIICPEYNGNPFGAKFVLANTSRDNAVASGEDTLMFGSDNPVDQKLLIYGRTFTQEDEKNHTVRDEVATKKRGEISLDIDSPWIQTEAAAKSLGEWIIAHWSGGADEVTVNIFGNPLIQLADVVSVNYPLMNMTPATHEYFVVGISHDFENGLNTRLVLRRRKI